LEGIIISKILTDGPMVVNAFVLLKVDSSIWWEKDILRVSKLD